MTVYLKTIYVRISQMVCKYTKAISLKKNFVLVTDGPTTRLSVVWQYMSGYFLLMCWDYASATTTFTFIVLQVIYCHC